MSASSLARLVTLDGAVALQSVRGAEPGHLLRLLP
jgi:hypothetical protein